MRWLLGTFSSHPYSQGIEVERHADFRGTTLHPPRQMMPPHASVKQIRERLIFEPFVK
ncbi:hypothetical protein SAMN02745132_03209 [Enterovibrio nigricans DSM 22720]|uniref:Uncharacterized protein n=1 Tax=Enterovibrio nigricans DSM 22720 TaxID=1121868 RepID=A0A1T4V4U9_9GAMM|nr:hypothetical protein SAMN02745132_03209 [Enterovibrio nigricans DSM 22720]